MSMNALALAATILLLFPMLYFLFASLAFFIRTLEHSSATFLLRGLFSVYFLAVAVIGGLGAVAFTAAGRPTDALPPALLVALALAARAWFLPHIDAAVRARDAGDRSGLRRLRQLHVGGIAYNAVQLVAVLASIPGLFPKGV